MRSILRFFSAPLRANLGPFSINVSVNDVAFLLSCRLGFHHSLCFVSDVEVRVFVF